MLVAFVFGLTCREVKSPGRQGVGGPETRVVAQRQADLDGSSDLERVGTRVQQDADGRHRLQPDASHHCRFKKKKSHSGKNDPKMINGTSPSVQHL